MSVPQIKNVLKVNLCLVVSNLGKEITIIENILLLFHVYLINVNLKFNNV